MASSKRGASTSQVEVTNIDRFGIWLLIEEKEYFLPYEDFPCFRKARVDRILNVELLHGDHLHWPDLDVDLCLDSLARPDAFPLIYRWPDFIAPGLSLPTTGAFRSSCANAGITSCKSPTMA